MKHFSEIEAYAADHKGGPAALEALLAKPKSADALKAIPDSRWLSKMSKCLFQAGFNWKVIENKWAGFEEAFEGFDPARWAFMSDEDLDRMLKDTRIVRNGQKIVAVRDNACFLSDLAQEHGSASAAFADWPLADHIDLLAMMKKRGGRLGGATGQIFLRRMGKDSFILSRDVVAALMRDQIVSKVPSSQRDMAAVQEAFNVWHQQSGRGLTQMSQILAFSAGS